MTDLIKFLRTSTSSAYNKTAADRIEELNERLTAATDDAKEAEAYAQELEERNKELTLQLLATSGQAADALDKLTECEARLSKAVESIKQSIKLWEKPDGGDRLSKLDNAYDGFELLCKALAKLEGRE